MDFERIFENKKGVEKDINNEVELNRRDANIKVSDMFETIFKGIFSEIRFDIKFSDVHNNKFGFTKPISCARSDSVTCGSIGTQIAPAHNIAK